MKRNAFLILTTLFLLLVMLTSMVACRAEQGQGSDTVGETEEGTEAESLPRSH